MRNIKDEKVQKEFVKQGPYSFILDLGTGTGEQIRRNIDLGVLKDNSRIIGVDINKEGIKQSINSFKNWASEKGYSLKKLPSRKAECIATVGVFDGIHLGHQFIIRKVKRECKRKNYSTTKK